MLNRVFTLSLLAVFLFQTSSCTKKSSKKSTPPSSSPTQTNVSPPSKETDRDEEPDLNGSESEKDETQNPHQNDGGVPSLETALALSSDLLEKNPQDLLALYRPIQSEEKWAPKNLPCDPILEWNEIMLDANALDHERRDPDQRGPTRTSRAFAITQLAMYDAYVSVVKLSETYLPQVSVPANTNAAVAASVAAYVSLRFLFPNQASRFDQAIHRSLQRYSYGVPEYNGILLGKYLALRLLVDRKNDGSEVMERYNPSGDIGTHDVDPLHPEQGFLDPAWGNVRPFAIPNTTRFAAPPPPSLRSREYASAFAEVKRLGGDGVTTRTARTKEETIIGIFWGYDGSPGLGTPPRLYNQIARTIARQKKNSVSENARLLALVNMAIADATIQCWADKYNYIFWRPILGIRSGDRDGNSLTDGNADWTPLGAQASNTRNPNFTPNFPSYTAGHAVLGAAGMGIIQSFYGTDNIPFTFVSDEFNGKTRGPDGNVRPLIPRTYRSVTQAIQENADSRVYLGIHWRFDNTEGIRSGLGIAEYIAEVELRPR